MIGLLFGLGEQLHAQPIEWDLFVDGEVLPWNYSRSWTPDSLYRAALDATAFLQEQGHLYARIDSHRVDSTHGLLYATPGPMVTIASLRLRGISSLDAENVRSRLKSKQGLPFVAPELEEDIQTILATYSEAGYHLASVSVDTLEVSPSGAHLLFRVKEGPVPLLKTVILFGAKRTSDRFATRVTGLAAGSPVSIIDMETVVSRLKETEAFDEVEPPILAIDSDSTLVIQIPVVEAPPGAFDIALGYERNESGGGALVGSGHLALRNLFGGGRGLSLTLNRAPGQVNSISVNAHDPFIFNLPVSLGVHFQGLQQDSTYGKRVYQLQLGYRFEGNLDIFALATREVSRPGLAGLEIVDNQQRIPVATALYAGLGVRVRDVDSRINPRKGYTVETSVESGFKDRTLTVIREDTLSESTRLQQSRLQAMARLYIPTNRRQVFVLGGETMLLHSDRIDESDLFRFGGARSLRGYDEERFHVPFATRVFVEYRRLLDAASHALVFFDLGYVDGETVRGFFPGFGVGVQLDTDAGLISFTAASTIEAPSEVRAHLSISLGL